MRIVELVKLNSESTRKTVLGKSKKEDNKYCQIIIYTKFLFVTDIYGKEEDKWIKLKKVSLNSL